VSEEVAIIVLSEERLDNGWVVQVQLGEQSDEAGTYNVQIDQDLYERLTGGLTTPGDLMEETFKFLLEREPKESIQKTFDLDVVSTYFRDYEDVMKDRL
jgi:hypothetical protein